MFIFFLLRRLSPRGRMVFGVVLMVVGLALVSVSVTLSADLLVHGVALIGIGAVLCTSAIVGAKRALRSVRVDGQ
jgi:drug/metabolite transporter (DMT)-like permease